MNKSYINKSYIKAELNGLVEHLISKMEDAKDQAGDPHKEDCQYSPFDHGRELAFKYSIAELKRLLNLIESEEK